MCPLNWGKYRITGYTERYLLGEWISPEEYKKKTKILPPKEQIKVKGEISFGPSKGFTGTIHNNTNWTITQTIIRIVGEEKYKGFKWKLNEKLMREALIYPQSSRNVNFDEVLNGRDISIFKWYVEEARGYK